jgi:hypothetical protein
MFGPEDEEYGAFEEPLFKDELEFEAEIEREVAANAREAEVAVMEPPWYTHEHVSPVSQPADVDGTMATEEAAGEEGEGTDIEKPDTVAEPTGPPREAIGSFMVPVDIDGCATSRELRRLAPRLRLTARESLRSGQLLSQPISKIRDAIDREAAAQAVARAEAADPTNLANNAAVARDVARDMAREAGVGTSAALWVDKYAPRVFMDLLSDERLNRHVLRWVRQWEGFVFGGRKRGLAAAMARSDGRPERPIMLISGPPGLGKTTLAHIVARHAGYRPDEINASDERSAKVLKQRVSEASEVQAVFSDRRPVRVRSTRRGNEMWRRIGWCTTSSPPLLTYPWCPPACCGSLSLSLTRSTARWAARKALGPSMSSFASPTPPRARDRAPLS